MLYYYRKLHVKMADKKEQKLRDRIVRIAGKAINKYALIKKEQRVAVAVSGGKDSYVLLESLALRKNHLPIDYTLLALHVHVENTGYRIDAGYLQSFCDKLKVPLHVRSITPDFAKDNKKSPCFICSWHKRKVLFSMVRELECTALALGHTMDDAVETLLMNMIYNATIGSMPPKLSMFNGEFDIIRPLYLVPETVINEYSMVRGFPGELSHCEYSEKNRREDIRGLMNSIEKLYKKGKNNIFHSMSHIDTDYLPPE